MDTWVSESLHNCANGYISYKHDGVIETQLIEFEFKDGIIQLKVPLLKIEILQAIGETISLLLMVDAGLIEIQGEVTEPTFLSSKPVQDDLRDRFPQYTNYLNMVSLEFIPSKLHTLNFNDQKEEVIALEIIR